MSWRETLKPLLPEALRPWARRGYFAARGVREQLQSLFSRRHRMYFGARDSALFQAALRGNMNHNCRELHVFMQYRMLKDAAAKIGKPLTGRILEIGACGHPGMALLLLLGGAEKVCLNNVFPIVNRLPESWAQNATVLMRLAGLAKRDLNDIVERRSDGDFAVKEALLDLPPPSPCENLRFGDSSYDMIFSNAVLEHVREPIDVLRNLHRMLAPNGWFVHAIDLRDHRDFNKPLEFLALSEAAYRTEDPYGNRHRASDWLRDFAASGFSVGWTILSVPHALTGAGGTDVYKMALDGGGESDCASLEQVKPWVAAATRERFIAPFNARDLCDLSVTGMTVAGQKAG